MTAAKFDRGRQLAIALPKWPIDSPLHGWGNHESSDAASLGNGFAPNPVYRSQLVAELMNLLAWPNPKQLGDAVIVETIGLLFNHVNNLFDLER